MKNFLIKIILFGLILFVLDKFFLVVRNKAPEFDNDRRLEYVLDGKVNKDLIVFGSSRANEDIATWLLEDALKLDSYNLCYGGSEIELQTFILKQLLKENQKPKLIIKIIDDDFELTYNSANVFRVDRLIPLVKYPVIRNELISRGEKNAIMSKLFVLHQLNKSNFDFRSPKKVNDTILKYGNITLNKVPKRKFEWTFGTKTSYSSDKEIKSKYESFKEFQDLCVSNNIKLVLSIPPSYKVLNKEFAERIRELKFKESYFHVYDQSKIEYKSSNYFNDLIHLNSSGAEIYTHDLILFIKNNIKI